MNIKVPQFSKSKISWIILIFCLFILQSDSPQALAQGPITGFIERIKSRDGTESIGNILNQFIKENKDYFQETDEFLTEDMAEPVSTGEKTTEVSKTEPVDIPLYACRDEELGVKVLCNPDWALKEENGTIMMIISADPAVTVTVTKIDENVRFIGQLNKQYLSDIGQYTEGFQIEEVKLAGQRAIKVKAFSLEYPEIRLLDYYVIHDSHLYGILFSVNPRDEWDTYKFLFRDIAQSLEFVNNIADNSSHLFPDDISDRLVDRYLNDPLKN